MATDKKLYDEGKNSGNDLHSLLRQFHRDFKMRSERILEYMKAENQREIETLKRQKLSNITSNISNISNVTNVSQVGKSQDSVIKSIIIPASKESNKDVRKDLQQINSTIITQSKEDVKKNKSIFKNSIIQARIAEGSFKYIKDFVFSGPSQNKLLINAVENVERAIRGEEKVIIDGVSRFQQFAEGLKGEGEAVTFIKKFAKAIPTSGSGFEQLVEGIQAAASGTVGILKNVQGRYKSAGSVKGAVMEGGKDFVSTAQNVINSLLSAISGEVKKEAPKDGKVKKTAQKGSTSIADLIIAGINTALTATIGAKLFKKKYGFLGAVALFGNEMDFAISTALTNPIKTFKLAMFSFKTGLDVIINRPYLQGIAASTALFGKYGGAIATVLIPIGKLLRPLFLEIPSLGDGLKSLKERFSSFGGKLKETSSEFKDIISKFGTSMKEKLVDIQGIFAEGIGSMLDKIKKKTGMLFLKAGVFLGIKGATMIGIMGTITSAAIAGLPFLIGGLIVAAVVGIGYFVYKKWDSVKEAWHDYIVEPIMGIIDSITQTFTEIKDKITSTVGGFFTNIFGDKTSDESITATADKASKNVKDKTITTITATDKTQQGNAVKEYNRIQGILTRTPEQHEERSKEMLSTMKDTLAELRKQKIPPPLIPPANIDDVATYIVTQ